MRVSVRVTAVGETGVAVACSSATDVSTRMRVAVAAKSGTEKASAVSTAVCEVAVIVGGMTAVAVVVAATIAVAEGTWVSVGNDVRVGRRVEVADGSSVGGCVAIPVRVARWVRVDEARIDGLAVGVDETVAVSETVNNWPCVAMTALGVGVFVRVAVGSGDGVGVPDGRVISMAGDDAVGCIRVAVWLGVAVALGVRVVVCVADGVAVRVSVMVGVRVDDRVGEDVIVLVGLAVRVDVAVNVGVAERVCVGRAVRVAAGVLLDVALGVRAPARMTGSDSKGRDHSTRLRAIQAKPLSRRIRIQSAFTSRLTGSTEAPASRLPMMWYPSPGPARRKAPSSPTLTQLPVGVGVATKGVALCPG